MSQSQSVLQYWCNRTIFNGMYTASAVAPVCRFQSVMATICSSVVVQRDHVDMYMAILSMIHSSSGRWGMI